MSAGKRKGRRSTHKIRANLLRSMRKTRTWTANTTMATANAVRKLTMPMPRSDSEGSLVVVSTVKEDFVVVVDPGVVCVATVESSEAEAVKVVEIAELTAVLAVLAADDSVSVNDSPVSEALEDMVEGSVGLRWWKRGEGRPKAGRAAEECR